MAGILCSMVGATFVTAVAEVIRRKTSIISLSSTAVSTSVSKFGGGSASFNGSTNRIELPHQSQLDLSGYSDWTIECWYYFTEPTARTVLNKDGLAGTYYPSYVFWTNASKQINFGCGGNATNWITVTRSTALASTTWYHLAAVKNGSTVTFYVDGVSAGTATFVGMADRGQSLYLGWENNGTYGYGNMDELRISKNARYTTGFTPSTSAFANDDNTVLLVHFDGTNGSTYFEDDNGVRAQKGLTAIGNAQIDTAQSKFGGSSYLGDGTGDYLTVDNLASDITGDFTFECFVRFNALPTSGNFMMLATGDGNRYIGLLNNAGTQRWESSVMTGANQYVARYTPTITTGVWYHIALVKSGSTLTFYQDGTALTATTVAGSMTSTSTLFTSGTNILAAYTSANYSLNGWMDEVRISNSARYTSNFTPTTTPFVNDTNTTLLLHMDGTDAITTFRDDNGVRTQLGLVAVNNTQISTAQSKFGGTSIIFDGTDDYLAVRTLPTLTGDATIELWARFRILPWNQTIGGGNYMMIYASGANLPYASVYRSGTGSQVNIQIALAGDRYGSFTKSGVNLAIDTWYHIAIVRSSGVFKCFFNGTELTTFVNDFQFTNSGRNENLAFEWFGKFSDIRGSWDGWMDEIRVSNIARYTADFTPSTTPFQNDANTVLLIHGDGANASTAFFDDNGRTPT